MGRFPRWAPYAAAGAGVLLYLVWTRRKANAGTGTQPIPSVSTSNGVDTTDYNPSDIAAMMPVMSGAASTEPAPYAPPTGEKRTGSGYSAAPGSAYTSDKSGAKYQAIPDPIAAAGLIKAGQKLYYQVLPGVFIPSTGPMLPGTTLFYKAS